MCKTDQIGKNLQSSSSKSDCASLDQDTHFGQIDSQELEVDTIVYTEAGKVKDLVEQLCYLINDTKAKCPPGAQSLPQA